MTPTHDSKSLITGDEDGTIKVWSVENCSLMYDYGKIYTDGFIWPIMLCPTKDNLYIAGGDGYSYSFLHQWTINNGRVTKESYDVDYSEVVTMCASRDGEFLFTLDKKGIVRKFCTERRKLVDWWRYFDNTIEGIQAFSLV
jgi:WD40 repeat protein